jgi:hypothetical protein
MERSPQYPQKCNLPAAGGGGGVTAPGRKLLGNMISLEEAKEACAHWKKDERDNCIADVIATSDLELAESNGY